MFQIGAKTWRAGNEITIISEPYELHGAMWQDGIDENGKEHTLPTPDQLQENVERQRQEWKEGQAAAKKLTDTMRASGLW